MRIVILGSPDSNKTGLATSLIRKYNSDTISQYPIGNPQDYNEVDRFALGDVADYRTELSLALLRQADMERYDDAVFTGTVLDSYAYALSRLFRCAGSDASTEKEVQAWANTTAILAIIVRDSFKADKVVVITNPLQEDPFMVDLEDAIIGTLDELEIPYVTVEAGFAPEKIVEELWN